MMTAIKRRVGDLEATEEELLKLIPSQAYTIIGNTTPEELEYDFKHHVNVDECYTTEMLLAYSYYQTLTPRERQLTKNALSALTVVYLLNWIGQNNPKLLDKIEAISKVNEQIFDYLENQIMRCKAVCLSFDELIDRGAKNVEPSHSPTETKSN